MKTSQKTSTLFTLIIIMLAIVTSTGGIFFENLYRDNELVKTLMFGNDLITLLLAVPLMIISLVQSRKGSLGWKLTWLGTCWYMIYNYIFYVYALAFNKFFLLYVFAVIFSALALIFGLINLDTKEIRERIAGNARIPYRNISVFMMFFAVFIGGMWIAMALSYVFTNQIPESILKYDHPTSVVFSTDLAFLVTPLLTGAILLWRKQVWGLIISSILFIKCFLYPLVLLIGGFLAYLKNGAMDSLTPGYLALGIGCAICFRYLMKGLRWSGV